MRPIIDWDKSGSQLSGSVHVARQRENVENNILGIENNILGKNNKCKKQMNIRRYFSDNNINKNNKKKRAEYQGKTASNVHNWGYPGQARRPTVYGHSTNVRRPKTIVPEVHERSVRLGSSKPTAKPTPVVCLDHGQTCCQVGKTKKGEHKINLDNGGVAVVITVALKENPKGVERAQNTEDKRVFSSEVSLCRKLHRGSTKQQAGTEKVFQPNPNKGWNTNDFQKGCRGACRDEVELCGKCTEGSTKEMSQEKIEINFYF